MYSTNWPVTAILQFAFLFAASIPFAPKTYAAQDEKEQVVDEKLKALAGEWLYVEDRTDGRAIEKQGPPMSVKFVLRVEKDALIHVRSQGDETVKLDGSVTEVTKNERISRYSGHWKDGALTYDAELLRKEDQSRVFVIRREFRITPDGLMVRVSTGDGTQLHGVALYRHPEDIELPMPAKATMDDMAWLSGAWLGKRGARSIEERWSPPAGGAMLGLSRTVSRGKMSAFEYLRIVERDGSLVYVAQPGGRPPTEFVLTKLDKNRAVFINPRHDYPQRIIYELSDEGLLTASIGFAKGGNPRGFMYKREAK